MKVRAAAIYARYSDGRDRDKATSIETQIAMCTEKAKREGLVVDSDHIYFDEAISGGTIDRPDLQRMMKNIRDKKVYFPEVLIIKDDKRLVRLEHEAGRLVKEIWDADVEIMYVTQNFGDPRESDEEWMMQRLHHIFAELERRRKAKETFAHQRQNALAGYWNGGKAPCGYKIVDAKVDGKEKKKLEIDPDIAPILKKVFEAYLEGMGFTKIAQLVTELNLLNHQGQPYTHSAIKHWIRVPFRFAGCMVWNTFSNQKSKYKDREDWVIIADSFPAIISMEQAEAVYQKTIKRKGFKSLKKTHYLLSQLMVCGQCGGTMVGKTTRSGLIHYRCRSRMRNIYRCGMSKGARGDKIETAINGFIQEKLINQGYLESYVEDLIANQERRRVDPNTVMQLQAEKEQLHTRIENALDLMLSSEIDNQRLKKKIEADEKRLVEIEDEIESWQLVVMPIVPDLEQFRKGLEEGLQGDFEVKRRTYTGLIERIVFYDHDEISIEFNLQTINHDPKDIDGRMALKDDGHGRGKDVSQIIPQQIHGNSCRG